MEIPQLFSNPNKADYVMYILINEELKEMDQIISQCCSLSCKVIRTIENLSNKPDYYVKWIENSEKKVLLKASAEDLIYCVSQFSNPKQHIWCQFILDIIRKSDKQNCIQVSAVAFIPMMSKKAPKLIKEIIQNKNNS